MERISHIKVCCQLTWHIFLAVWCTFLATWSTWICLDFNSSKMSRLGLGLFDLCLTWAWLFDLCSTWVWAWLFDLVLTWAWETVDFRDIDWEYLPLSGSPPAASYAALAGHVNMWIWRLPEREKYFELYSPDIVVVLRLPHSYAAKWRKKQAPLARFSQ